MIVPLTKRKTDGTLYQRPDIIEPLLAGLANQPRDVLLERALIRDRKHPDYMPSECLLYFVRSSRRDNSDAWFEQLYKVLIERVLRSVPRAEISRDSSSLSNERIRNAVFDRFVEMLAKDRKEPDDKLDFSRSGLTSLLSACASMRRPESGKRKATPRRWMTMTAARLST